MAGSTLTQDSPASGDLPPSVEIRKLAPADAAAWRALRLEALQMHPAAFAESFEEAAQRDLAWFRDRMPTPGAANAIFGVFDHGQLVGCAGFAVQTLAHLRHKGVMWGVYLRPGLRGRGIGAALVGRVIRHARQQVAVLQAAVAVDNIAAAALYRRAGFKSYGREPRALRVDSRDIDEELLAIDLN
ncbi:GNAT family N-acetyltransferase [Desertibaculum subflavum]|uniref:GNAT family N-acetyltransferase n=1 Tax=Desertibaculum subflavum TaxID=2268458 RepID=UPI0013C3F6B1